MNSEFKTLSLLKMRRQATELLLKKSILNYHLKLMKRQLFKI